MDLQERLQLDVAHRVNQARARVAPWRSIIAAVLAVGGGVAAEFWGVASWHALRQPGHYTGKLVFVAGLAAFAAFGVAAVVGLSAAVRAALQPVIGQAHAGIVRYLLLLAGLFAVLVVALAIWGISPGRLVLGGAVTGVLLGIAAQQSLGNVFAGLVLLFTQPFRVGDQVVFRAGALSGQIAGVVTDLSLTYVRMETSEGQMMLPNSQALNAAVLLVPDAPDGAGDGDSPAAGDGDGPAVTVPGGGQGAAPG